MMRLGLLRLGLLPALGLLTLAGCSAAPSPTFGDEAAGHEASAEASRPTERRVMVTLPTDSPFLVRRSIRELSVAYDLSFVASWTMASLRQECVVFEVPGGVATRDGTMERLVASLSRDHRVDLAQRVQRFATSGGEEEDSPDGGDSRSSYRRFQHSADLLRLDEAHRVAIGEGVRVAVIDTGMDLGHPEFGRRIVEARDFVGRDDESFTSDLHGTAVAGLLAAGHDDGAGIVGVAPGVDLLAVKACWAEPAGGRRAVCDSYTLALALDYAVTAEAKVINLSLGGPEDPILRRLVEAGLERSVVVVAANGGPGADFPATVAGVLEVRPLPKPGESEGKTGDWLSAPGREILTTVPGGYDFWNGVSMSTAQVSGVAALVLELRPKMAPEDLALLLRGTSRDNPGHGLVDACAAVEKASGRNCTDSGD